ncbi:MAG: HPr family phosphocarrier protein [Lachnospiraceae bacterium]|jgi:phosphocarrier protein HPr|nr:HPr family phosphocarrier protein [Lachnospiraceae bacterium]
MTQHRMIKLDRDSAKEFVRLASHCDFDIDIANGNSSSYTVDGKSMLGVIGLDLSSALVVTYDGYNADFENFLSSKAAVA